MPPSEHRMEIARGWGGRDRGSLGDGTHCSGSWKEYVLHVSQHGETTVHKTLCVLHERTEETSSKPPPSMSNRGNVITLF